MEVAFGLRWAGGALPSSTGRRHRHRSTRRPPLYRPQVRAIRAGREQALPVRDVLVGDLLIIETGDILCTDGMLVAGSDVKCAQGWQGAAFRGLSSLLGAQGRVSGAGSLLGGGVEAWGGASIAGRHKLSVLS